MVNNTIFYHLLIVNNYFFQVKTTFRKKNVTFNAFSTYANGKMLQLKYSKNQVKYKQYLKNKDRLYEN